MIRNRIFISYDYDNDSYYKNLLIAWDKNKDFDFSFYDVSVDVSIDSTNANYIKRVIEERIAEATHFLCIIGKYSFRSEWINWEIDKATSLRKKIVAVKISADNTSPKGLLEVGASWAFSFAFDSIKKAIEDA